MRYTVEADLYDGPLALLVELVRLRLVDVMCLKLQGMTRTYRSTVSAPEIDVNALAEPLPLFGQLMALKASGLLPDARSVPDEEEPPIGLEELERRLKEYEQFKTVAQLLAELRALQRRHVPRAPGDPVASPVAPPVEEGLMDVGLPDLMGAFAKVLTRVSVPVYEVKAEPWTVEMKVKELTLLLTLKRQVRFLELFTSTQSTLELVVTFLGLLELIRQRVVRAVQEQLFGEILIIPRPGASPLATSRPEAERAAARLAPGRGMTHAVASSGGVPSAR